MASERNTQLPVFDEDTSGTNTDYDAQTLENFNFSLIESEQSTFDDEELGGITDGSSDDSIELTEEDIEEITLPGSGTGSGTPTSGSNGGTTPTPGTTQRTQSNDPLKNMRTSDAKVFQPISPTDSYIKTQDIGSKSSSASGNRSAGNASKSKRYTGQLNESMFQAPTVLDVILKCNPVQIGIVNKQVPFTWNRHEEIHFIVDNVYPVINTDLTGTLDVNWGKTYFCAIGMTFAFKNSGNNSIKSTSAWELTRGAEVEFKGIRDYPNGRVTNEIYQKLNQIKDWSGALLSRVKITTQVGEGGKTEVKAAGHVMLVIGVKTDSKGNIIAFNTIEYNAALGNIRDAMQELNTGTDGNRDGGLIALNTVTVASLCGLSTGTEQFPLRNTAWRIKNLSNTVGGSYCSTGIINGPDTELTKSVLNMMTSGDPEVVQRPGITSLLQVCR